LTTHKHPTGTAPKHAESETTGNQPTHAAANPTGAHAKTGHGAGTAGKAASANDDDSGVDLNRIMPPADGSCTAPIGPDQNVPHAIHK